MIFKKWLKKYKDESGPLGDFADDALADKSFPKQKQLSKDKLETYLIFEGACDEAIKAGKQLWGKYEKEESKANGRVRS